MEKHVNDIFIFPLSNEWIRQWIVVKRQCVRVKEDLEENSSGTLVKQENVFPREQYLPINQKLDEDASSLLSKEEKFECKICIKRCHLYTRKKTVFELFWEISHNQMLV